MYALSLIWSMLYSPMMSHLCFVIILQKQLFGWIIHVDSVLHFFCLWDSCNVHALCLQIIVHAEHILHLLDRASACCNDGYILAL